MRMNVSGVLRSLAAGAVSVAVLWPALGADVFGQAARLRQALTFYAPFDGGVDAAHALGNPTLYNAPSMGRRQEATPGLPPSGETRLAAGEGRFGDALRFTVRRKPAVFFEGGQNMSYQASNWNGTVSFWLSVDPAADLDLGFCDPVQITPRMWNDAAFFVEFEKKADSAPFRLGVYADFPVWNPTKRDFATIPDAERPLVTVDRPPFGHGKWTHVVFTFDHFNTGKSDGVARLYLDGIPAGELSPRQQTFTWDPAKTAVGLGLSYVGLMDEFSVFNRALSADEVKALHALPAGVASLMR